MKEECSFHILQYYLKVLQSLKHQNKCTKKTKKRKQFKQKLLWIKGPSSSFSGSISTEQQQQSKKLGHFWWSAGGCDKQNKDYESVCFSSVNAIKG